MKFPILFTQTARRQMMFRYSVLFVLLAGWLLGSDILSLRSIHAAQKDRRPNVIFILADDLGYGELGCYGQQKIKTPRIDSLAAEGVRFTQAYAGSNVCQPSRCTILTGMHTGHAAIRANDHDQMLLSEDVTIAELLRPAGYATGIFGKWGQGFVNTPGHPNRQGFDEFFGMDLQVQAHFYYPYWLWQNEEKFMLPGNEMGKREQYVQDIYQDRALQYIQTNNDKPFFMYLNYIIPHVELAVPEESERPYRGKFPKVSIQDMRPGYIGSEDGLTTLAGMISHMDNHVGQILDLLKKLKIDDQTIVFFTSDNGGQNGGKDQGWTKMTDYFQGNGLLRGYKGAWYEGGIRVPLIVRAPGKIQSGKTSDHVCAFWDVLPTICDLTGVKTPDGIDGLSFAPTLTGRSKQAEHDGLYWEYPTRDGRFNRAARMGQWKAIQNRPEGPLELYDLTTDISEKKNLASKHPEIVSRMIQYMDAQHVEIREYPVQNIKPGIQDYVR